MVTVQFGSSALQFDVYTLLVWAFIGLVAGFLASRVMLGHGMGLIGDVAVGIIGAIIGGLLSRYFNVSLTVAGYPIVSGILTAFLGALVLLVILRLAGLRHRRYVVS